ncbi:hypothetical protein H0H87_006088 [Tephrocybe sp. NHM501043]|nr:hypothetical protein H0H87_006088 [Tephrocybe sp. NHM501043]
MSPRFCATNPTPEEVAAAQKHFVANASRFNGTSLREDRQEAAFTVGVYWNVLYDQNNPADGNIPDASIAQAMRVVNSYYNNIGLYFQVAGINRYHTDYNTLHSVTMQNDYQIKRSLRKGNSPQILNIYTVGTGPSGYAGWSSFPWDYQANPVADGIIYDYTYLPGSNRAGYNTGKVLAHEVGHWTGLFHPFEGGCNGGDYVDDTPAEAVAATVCQARDSCPGAGSDPINNMMDYTDDNCRIGFTSGQYNRLGQMVYQYRGINLY